MLQWRQYPHCTSRGFLVFFGSISCINGCL
nr:MAG TPA: hypothetical protein [Caudoviricetes sp.]